jgi:uncharacterized protein (DUF2147 family)
VRPRMQVIAGSMMSAKPSGPSAARSDAMGLLGQALAQRVAGGFGEAIIALGATLCLLLWRVLLSKYRKRHTGEPPDTAVAATSRAVQFGAGSLSRRSGFAAKFRGPARYLPAGIVATLTIALAAASASAQPASSPVGNWTTANGHGVVTIAPCGDALCGRIVGIDRKPTEPMPTDVDGRPQCGLTIITNERSQPDGTWLGQVTDPRDGGVYGAKLWLDAQGNLRLRGYIGIPVLGATQTWHRFTGHLTAECGLV